MIFLRPFFLSAIVTAAVTTLSPAQDAPQDLKLHWEPGQFYLQESDTDTTTFLTALGQKHDQKLRMRQTTSIRVTEAPGQSRKVEVTIDSLTGELLHDGLLNPFDASKIDDALPMLQKSIGHAAGKTFTLLYDDKDQFLSVQGISSFLNTKADEPDLKSIADAKQMATLYRRSLEMGLPKIPVRPGDKWISDQAIPFAEAGIVQIKLNAKFESIAEREGRRQAHISFEGTLETQPEADTKRAITFGPDSKVSGQVFFDLERRTISFSTLTSILNLLVEGKKLPVRQKVTTRLVAMKQTGK